MSGKETTEEIENQTHSIKTYKTKDEEVRWVLLIRENQ